MEAGEVGAQERLQAAEAALDMALEAVLQTEFNSEDDEEDEEDEEDGGNNEEKEDEDKDGNEEDETAVQQPKSGNIDDIKTKAPCSSPPLNFSAIDPDHMENFPLHLQAVELSCEVQEGGRLAQNHLSVV